MRYNLIIFLFPLLFTCSKSYSQSFSIQGKVIDPSDSSGLPGATVILERKDEDGASKGIVTDFNGDFKLEQVLPGNYLIKITFIGFKEYKKSVEVKDKSINLGRIFLPEETTTLHEIEIIGKMPPARQKGDTTQFNAAAFKTTRDASAQDLIEKMPSISMQDGKIQAQGEDVQQILVDGKPFFGTDVNAALQNLPAEIIDRIEVYDRRSEKEELSGFDDGNRMKTINIITKPNRRKGVFGRISGGYGTDERYLTGASLNFFNEDRRITITGLSNNINTLNFSADPNAGNDTRTQNGIINTNVIGANYMDNLRKNMELSASYFLNHRQNIGDQFTVRDYILPSDSMQVYTEERHNDNTQVSHNFHSRFDYKINDRNRLLIIPNISLKHNYNHSDFSGITMSNRGVLNRTENSASASNLDYDYDNRIFYSHRFLKPGRSITFNMNTGYHTNYEDAFRFANNVFFTDDERNEILDQYINYDRTGFNWDGKISYTEPFGKNGQVELEYKIGNRFNDSERILYNAEEQIAEYIKIDTFLSNSFKSEYLTQELELGYQYRTQKLRLQVEAEYQRAELENLQIFPVADNMNRVFHSILPSARMDYKISPSSNIEVNYRTWTNAPSIGQLQDVINNTNPLHLRTGNPDLDQQYQNWLRARYRSHNPENNKTIYASVQASMINNFITTSTFNATRTIELAEGIEMREGSQLSKPVNMNGYWHLHSYFNYGQPLEFIQSNFNVHGGINHTKRPGMINDEVNFSSSSNFRLGFSLSSNISENIDFNIFTRSNYNVVENSLRQGSNNNFFTQFSRIRYTWILWKGLVFRTDLVHNYNSGLAEGIDNSFLLWNMSMGKKIFKSQLGELSLNVYDLLDQNNNIRRNVNELFVEDFQSNVLQRYFMLTFTYNLRHFSRGTTMEDYEERFGN